MVIHLFGDRLKELRKERNLTQEEIGTFCKVGKTTISNWENNITQPPFEIVKKLAHYFGVTADYLLGLNQNDINRIDKLNIALREAGMIDSNENLNEEEIKLALDQARQYKQMWKRINDLPNKYPEGSIKREQINKKDTN